jgi:chromosome segregation ATPase
MAGSPHGASALQVPAPILIETRAEASDRFKLPSFQGVAMAKNIKPEAPIVDMSSLEQLGETTTAAELVRTKGQSKKVRIISEKKLMDWIMAMLQEHMAGKADAFSDKEKEELLKKTQDELAKRIKREQQAEAERDRIKSDLDRALGTLTNTKASQEDLDAAMAALKAKLEETEQINQDLQQDNYDLHDKLNEKMALVSTTIAEKDRLKETVKNQMLRSNALVEGVLGLDSQLYGGRHQDENPVDEGNDDQVEEAQFYHDFEVGAKVIETLSNDLQRLRGIASSAKQKDEQLAHDPRLNLLEGDLKLLEELKEGSLHGMDVAQPVAGLVEAMEGARLEAEQLEHAGNEALGVAAGREEALASVPDANGDPAEVIAGTTGVVRELASSLARARQRMVALKEMADQADEARNTAEEEGEAARAAHQRVLSALAERAAADRVEVAVPLADEQVSEAQRSDAAVEVIHQLQAGGGDTKRALSDQLEMMNRLLGEDAGVHMAPLRADADQQQLLARLHENGEALERLLREKQEQLAAALKREHQLAEQLRALAKARTASISPEFGEEQPLELSLKRLDQALGARQPAHAEVAAATGELIASLQAEVAKAPSNTDLKRLDEERGRLASQVGQAQGRIAALEREVAEAKGELAAAQSAKAAKQRADRELAQELVGAAKGDDQLADISADLALAVENGNAGGAQANDDLGPQVREALTLLSRRKRDLAEEAERLKTEVEASRAQAQEATNRATALQAEREKLAYGLNQAQQRVQDLERDLSRAKTDAEALRTQSQESNTRRSGLEAERSKLLAQAGQAEGRVRELDAELAAARQGLEQALAARRAKDESDRQVATELVRAAQGDPDLAEATADLALALEDTASSEQPVDSATVTKQVSEAVAVLAKRKQDLAGEVERIKRDNDAFKWQLKEASERASALEGERDEMAASGKEIINLLTQQRERAHQELEALKVAHDDTQQQLARFEHRVSAAETANRQLAEALSMLAAQEKDQSGVEDKRVDLELALSQLPDEGEDAVTIPDDLSLQLASSGQKLAEALLARRQAVTTSFAKAQKDQEALKAQVERMKGEIAAAQAALDDQESALRSSQAEVKAVRNEIASQGRELAAKVQELTSTRGEMASLKAELSVTAQRVEDQERRLQQTANQLADSRREYERLQGEHHEAQARGDAALHAQAQLVQGLRSLTNRQDASPALARALTEADFSDPLSKAAQKLDMAQAAGPEQLAIAGQAYVQALKDRVQGLAEELEEKRGEISGAKAAADALHNEVAAIRAAVVDRDHQIENLASGLEKAKTEQSELLNQLIEQRRAHDHTAASLKQLQEQLRLAQAELADYQAREGASSGHFSSDNDRLRSELDKERQDREKLEAELSELRERVESGDARLRAQRDEFTRRLTERDGVIQQKDRQLDALASERSDAKSLEAQVAVLSKELDAANDRIKELEGVFGAHAGVASKSGDLARELKNLQAERDQLREKHRQTEADLTDAVSLTAQLKTQLDEKRKEVGASREKLAKELAEEREKSQAMRDEFRKLKEEVVGLRARIRRLTDGGTASGGFQTLKDK